MSRKVVRTQRFPSAPAGIGPAVLVLALAGLSSPPAAAGPGQLPAADRLGEETSAYVYRQGWETLRERLRGTAALTALENPQVQAFFGEIQRVAQRPGPEGRAFELALAALHSDLVLAGTARDPQAAGGATPEAEELEESGVGSLEIGLVMPVAAHQARFGQLAAAVLQGRGPAPSGTGADAFVPLWKGEDESGGTAPLFHWDGRVCFWANSRPAAAWALRDKPASPLADSKFFRGAVDPLYQGRTDAPLALYYYDLRPTWAGIEQSPAAPGWRQMSWRSLDAVAGATFIDSGGFRNRHYWKIGDARAGLFQYTREARLNWDWLQRVPADASGLTTGVFDAASLVGSVACLGAWVSGADAATISQIPNFVLPAQVALKAIGHRYLIYRMPGRYGSFPMTNFLPNHNLVMVIEAPDVAAVRGTIDALVAMGEGAIETTTTRIAGREVIGVNLYSLTLYVAPLEHEVLIAVHPQLLKDALENWQKPGPGLVDTPAFREARKHVLENACFLMYFPPGGFARGIYDEYIPQLQALVGLVGAVERMWDNSDEPPPAGASAAFDPLLLPRGRDVAGHVTQGTILSARDDGPGILFDGYAPLLSTPYYWTYVHALTRLGRGQGLVGAAEPLAWMFTPAAAPEPRPQPATQPAPPAATGPAPTKER